MYHVYRTLNIQLPFSASQACDIHAGLSRRFPAPRPRAIQPCAEEALDLRHPFLILSAGAGGSVSNSSTSSPPCILFGYSRSAWGDSGAKAPKVVGINLHESCTRRHRYSSERAASEHACIDEHHLEHGGEDAPPRPRYVLRPSRIHRQGSGALTMCGTNAGTWRSNPGAVEKAVEHALKNGYRHIDTATGYGTYAAVNIA